MTQILCEGDDIAQFDTSSALTNSEGSATPHATVIDGILVLSPDKLCSVARQPGSVGPDEINAIATQLSAGLPAVR